VSGNLGGFIDNNEIFNILFTAFPVGVGIAKIDYYYTGEFYPDSSVYPICAS
jgi:hypothetical protein